MKINDYKIKLKNIKVTPIDENKCETMEDVMYLYYTLQIELDDNIIEFNAYDSPTIQKLSKAYKEIENIKPVKANIFDKREVYLSSPFNIEHNTVLTQYKADDYVSYDLHIYESFGNSVLIEHIEEKDILKLIKYVDKKINKAIKQSI